MSDVLAFIADCLDVNEPGLAGRIAQRLAETRKKAPGDPPMLAQLCVPPASTVVLLTAERIAVNALDIVRRGPRHARRYRKRAGPVLTTSTAITARTAW